MRRTSLRNQDCDKGDEEDEDKEHFLDSGMACAGLRELLTGLGGLTGLQMLNLERCKG